MIVKILMFFVEIIIILVWAIIGLFFWIPFMARMIAYFMGMIILSTVEGLDLHSAQQKLEFAIAFYPNGFKKIISAFHSSDSNGVGFEEAFSDVNDWLRFGKKIAIDLIWLIIFWSLTYSMLLKPLLFMRNY